MRTCNLGRTARRDRGQLGDSSGSSARSPTPCPLQPLGNVPGGCRGSIMADAEVQDKAKSVRTSYINAFSSCAVERSAPSNTSSEVRCRARPGGAVPQQASWLLDTALPKRLCRESLVEQGIGPARGRAAHPSPVVGPALGAAEAPDCGPRPAGLPSLLDLLGLQRTPHPALPLPQAGARRCCTLQEAVSPAAGLSTHDACLPHAQIRTP